MRKIITVLVILTLLAMATLATAASKEPVGDRINVFYGGSMEFPAGVPFHIRHGWLNHAPNDAPMGTYDFELEVDGVMREEDFVMRSAESGYPGVVTWIWVYNFPNGMTGTRTFTVHWFAACQYAVDWLGFPGPCATPNEKVETRSRTLTVTFVP